MDIFQNNEKLEEAYVHGLDYALYSRHDSDTMLTPFMMLHKDGKAKMVRVVADGDPMESFQHLLAKEEQEEYNQIVLCFEGRVGPEGEKQDAILVKVYDTSHDKGLMFFQRFRGIESGRPFMKIGNPAYVADDVPPLVTVRKRETNKSVEEPYLSGIAVNEESGGFRRVLIAGHDNASYLANHLFGIILNILEKNESDFSGKIELSFVPNTMPLGSFTEFIFEQLIQHLKNQALVQDWEEAQGKMLDVELKFNDDQSTSIEKKHNNPNKEVKANDSDYSAHSIDILDAEFYKIMAIPNARTNIAALEAMSDLMKEYKKRGVALPTERQSASDSKKPWWKFW